MPNCPYGAQTNFEPRQCPCEQRITDTEECLSEIKRQLKEVTGMVRPPQVTSALIMAGAGVFCGVMSFLGVILGPMIRIWLGYGG